LARPDGTLQDLQPQYTDCNTIDSGHIGSEYAKQACLTNTYPYLYWAGRSLSGVYPDQSDGWVVSKADLSDFLQAKLTQAGLNEKERSDMLAYWVPAMLAKDVPYYKVSFIQTAEMNKFIPMDISPRPDSLYRIFLDWEPLSAQPSEPLHPQQLQSFIRTGFTVVEWGGLKQ
jgi:hypothetical protein